MKSLYLRFKRKIKILKCMIDTFLKSFLIQFQYYIYLYCRMQNILRQTYLYLAFEQALKDLKLQKYRDKLDEMLRPCIVNMLNIRIEALSKQHELKSKKDADITFQGKQLMNSQFGEQRFQNMKYRALVYDSPLSINFQSSEKTIGTNKNPQKGNKNIFLLQLYCKQENKVRGMKKKRETKSSSKEKKKSHFIEPKIRQNPYGNESQRGTKKRNTQQ